MPLVSGRELVAEAAAARRAVVGGNVSTVEMARALIGAAEQTRRPVLAQFNRAGLKQIGGAAIAAAAVRELAGRVDAPIGLHLDHADTLEELRAAIEAGFTSLMIDGSTLPYARHAALAREARGLAAWQGLPLEAELGHVSGVEEGVTLGEAAWTDPEEAARFAAESGVDWLAVAVGNTHGGPPAAGGLQRERLEAIAARVELPLVLHGASGLDDEDLLYAVRNGVAKINVGTALHEAMAQGIGDGLAERPSDLRGALRRGEERMRAVAEELLTAEWAL